jgi:DNA-binding CsgD family transcriptional regulator
MSESLYVAPSTVRTQIKSIYRKLGASSRGEAVEEARARGLL